MKRFLSKPGALAADAHGNVIITDLYNGRICRRDADGRPLPEWSLTADLLFADVAVSRPSGLALDGAGNIFMAGGGPHVQQFDGAGRPLLRWRADWQGQLMLEHPSGVAVDSHGDVYVADAQANRVSKFRILTATDR